MHSVGGVTSSNGATTYANGTSTGTATPPWVAHILASGISATTLLASHIQSFTGARLANIPAFCSRSTDSYFIPYFDLKGRPVQGFYRIRLLPEATRPDGAVIKYFQPPDSGVRLYFPPAPIIDPERWRSTEDIFITEGEKKALKAAQEGLLCIGLGGVHNWRQKRRTTKVSKSAYTNGRESKDGKFVTIKDTEVGNEDEDDNVGESIVTAPEMLQIRWKRRRVYIVFDNDSEQNDNVQDAAHELAIWLYDHDADVRQVRLPKRSARDKVGFDDFLRDEGIGSFRRLLPAAQFPAHSDPKRWIKKTLKTYKDRTGFARVGRSVVASLDSGGQRYVDINRHYYFFNNDTKSLHDFDLSATDVRGLRLTSFGDIIMNDYGLLTTDGAAVSAVADLYTKIGPPSLIEPRRAVYATHDPKRMEDILYYQLGDSKIAKVTADSITFVDNGTDNVLFLSNTVAPVDEEAVQDCLAEHSNPQNLWLKAFQDFNIRPLPTLTLEETHLFLCALFHINPWLKKWRGLLLPFELAVAEPNSGKTFLYNLRKGVLTGSPSLDNMPTDMRSFHAQAKAAAGIWVCDNLGDLKRELREELSDELARLITEPDPHATTRKLFTTDEAHRIDIDCTFAATAIRNPFWKPDILQRMLIFRMQAIPAGQRDSYWYLEHLEHRPEWIAEHLTAIQHFFRLVRRVWQRRYLSGHRLMNFEQSIGTMISALGFKDEAKVIIPKLQTMVQRTIAENDPTMEALRTYTEEVLKAEPDKTHCTYSDIVEWVETDMEGRFSHLKTLKSTIALSRYFDSHAYDIHHSAGLVRDPYGNTMYLRLTNSAGIVTR